MLILIDQRCRRGIKKYGVQPSNPEARFSSHTTSPHTTTYLSPHNLLPFTDHPHPPLSLPTMTMNLRTLTILLRPSTRTRTLPTPPSSKSPPLHLISIPQHRRTGRTRTMSTTTTPAQTPVFSSNYDPEQGARDLAPLLAGGGGRWALIESGKGVERRFRFKTFKKTWVSFEFLSFELSLSLS